MFNSENPHVSAVILTLNEAETVETAITSLSWCHEIFVVDSDSHDRTREIASGLGAKVVVHKQDGVFLISEQRNWALQNLDISGDWVLFMDADEESTSEFSHAVVDAVNASEYEAFYAAPAFMYYGRWIKHMSGYPNWHPRMVKRDSKIAFTGGVWEDFSDKSQVGYLSAPYIHDTNSKGLEDWLNKHVRYAQWESAKIKSSAGSPSADRRGLLRIIRYRLGGLRKYFAMGYLFLIRKGFLDGAEGRSYLRRMFIYELLIDEFNLESSLNETKRDPR